MKDPDNILGLAQLKPEYMGFIFYADSPRNFEDNIPAISEEIKKTGVFVNSSIEFIKEKVIHHGFKAVQLHGNESAEFTKKLRSVLGKNIEIIKVFSVKEEFDFNLLQEFEAAVDYFLFDTKGKNKGGNGYAFDWEILKNYPSTTPFFLSGGIGPEDYLKIEEFRDYLKKEGKGDLLFAVDLNSRFETAPGYKDLEKFKKFKNNLVGK